MEIVFIVAFLIFLAGWIVAEIRGAVTFRRVLGGLAIGSACLLGIDQGRALGQFNANHWYQTSMKRLLVVISDNMEPGSRKELIIRNAVGEFRPTYEGRGEYEKVVNTITEQLNQQPNKPEVGNGENVSGEERSP